MGVAVSGGADSTVLLHILHRLAEELQVTLAVLHVNHGWRGAESDEDEAFVRRTADKLGLPFVLERCAREAGFGETGNREAQARAERKSFFGRCRDEHSLTRIALGHTKSDQAETVLHRLLRGTGTTGLAAMRFVTGDGLVRPFLAASRGEIREWAKGRDVSWREDSSNEDLGFTRNRLRRETLPALTRTYNPRLESVLAGTALLAQAEEEYFEEQVERLYRECAAANRLGIILQVEDVVRLHLAMQRRLIRRVLSGVRPNGAKGLDLEHVESVRALLDSTQGHDRVLIPGADVLRSFDSVLFATPGRLNAEAREYQLEIPWEQWCRLPFGAGEIYINRVKQGTEVHGNFKEDLRFGEAEGEQAQLDANALAPGRLTVRNWEPGDRLQRPGDGTAEKIKTLFGEHRVRLWERRYWPVVVCGSRTAWVKRFGVAAEFQSTGVADTVRLVYRAG